ncbi:MAG TPA: peptidylprolyl isomerase, partial [Gammaproteobacteria bacterium]|nr:peptidylprolyl isomerase [Gammaproteobacteria bacterium]
MPANPACPRIRNLLLAGPLFLVLLLGAALSAPRPASADQLVDRIVAVVNDDVITATELEQALQQSIQRLRQRMGAENLPSRSVLRRQLLDRMIIDRIQLQKAKERGIEVSPQEVDGAISRIAGQNNLSLSQFRKALERRGVDYGDYRDRIKKQMLRSRLQAHAVRSKVHVTDEEVNSYLARQGKGGRDQYEYKLQHILVAVPEQASPSKTQKLHKKAEGLLQRIRSGEQFAKVAAAASDGQKALQGGELGWFKPGELPAQVLAEVEAVKPGHLSRVVRTPSGFHIFKVTDRRPLKASKEAQVKVQQILLQTGPERSVSQARDLAKELLRQARTGKSSFAELARQFSDGPSGRNGGKLGWVSRGDMVQPFEQLIF